MARRHRVLFWLVGAPLLLFVLVVAILSTPPAAQFIVGKAIPMINRQINGTLTIREARGSVFGRLDLRGMRLTDEAGAELATAERLVVGYRLLDLLRGRIQIDPLILEQPSIRLVQDRPGEPYPLMRVFQKETPGTNGGRSSVALRGLEISRGRVVMTVPTQRRPPGEEKPSDDEAPLRTIHVDSLDLKMPVLDIAMGGTAPLEAHVRIDRVNAEVSDPRLSLRALEGEVTAKGDSISVDLTDAELPSSKLSVKGWMVMTPQQRPSFNGELHIARLSTADLAGISSQVPPGWRLSGEVRARGDKVGNMDAELTTVEVVGARQAGAVRGHLAMSVAPDGRWRQRGTQLEFDNLDLAPLLAQLKQAPAVPVDGRLRGKLSADGSQDSLKVKMDLALRQVIRDTTAESSVKGGGELSLPLGGSLFVRDFIIDTAQIDMKAVRAVNPSLPLTGKTGLTGSLRGSMQDLAFIGAARYQEGTLPPSVVRTTARLTRHSPLHLDADVVLDSLRLDGFQQSFPSMARAGAVGGKIHLSGPLDTLTVDGMVGGVPGRLQLAGTVSRGNGTIALQNAHAEADSINLAAVSSTLPKSLLFARFSGSAAMRDSTLESADIHLSVDSSRIEGMSVSTASVVAKTGGGLLLVDSLVVRATGLAVDGSGTLGLADHRGTLTVNIQADSLDQLGPLFALVDTAGTMTPHRGAVKLDAAVTGSLQDYRVEFNAQAQEVTTEIAGIKAGTFVGSWGNAERRFSLQALVDSLATSRLTATRIDAAAEGTVTQFAWRGTALFSHNGKVSGSGKVAGDSASGRRFDLDSLTLTRDSATWRLQQPARIEVRDDLWSFSNTVLVRSGSADPATVSVVGSLSARDSSGKVSAVIDNFQLADLALYPATAKAKPLTGTLDARFDLTGSVSHPRGTGQLSVLNAKYDTLPLPELRAKAGYNAGILDANMAIILGSRPSVLEARVPLIAGTGDNTAHLAFTADSLTVGWLDPLLPAVQDLAGRIDGKVEMTGTFEHPEMKGNLAFTEGAATALSLGVHYHDIHGNLAFSGQTIRVDTLEVNTGDKGENETLNATGTIRMEPLNNPVLDLTSKVNHFAVMNDENLFKGDASGDVKLTGPLFAATLTGRANVEHGTVYFQQFVQKRVIDLSDSLYAQFVDTTVLRKEKLEADPVTRFIEGLSVTNLGVNLGDNLWMKSDDANIQVSGRVSLDKIGQQYAVGGTVNTVRGTYTLRMAPGTAREFQVDRGTIQYLGTSDLNATLEIPATYQLQTSAGDFINVTVHIGGTVLEPRIDLTSDMQPPLAESELISYLIFGAPSFQAFMSDRSGERRSVFEESVKSFTGILSGQLENSLAGWLPLDYFKIQPGEVQSGLSGTELIMGKQVNLFGYPSWLKASPRICPGEALLSIDQIGLSLESRLTRSFGLNATLDPLRGCETALPPSSTHYGFGFDVFWEKRGLGFRRGRKK